MNEELDLGPYLAALRRYWYLPIVGLVSGLLLASIITLAQGRGYTAVATVSIPAPRYQWRLASGIGNVSDTVRKDPRDDLLSALGTAAVAAQVADKLAQPAGATGPVGSNQSAIDVGMLAPVKFTKVGSALVQVEATTGDPGRAVALANAWADTAASLAAQNASIAVDAAGMQAALDAASGHLADADRAYEQLKAETGLELRMGGNLAANGDRLFASDALGKQELILQNTTLAEYTQSLAYLRLLIQKAEQMRVAGGTPNALPLELLQTRVLQERGNLVPEVLKTTSWDKLLTELRSEEAALTETVSTLEASALAIQEELSKQYTELTNLERERAILADVVGQLTRKVEEIRLQQLVDPVDIKVVGYAESSARADWTGRLAVIALAGLLGLGVGVLAALLSGTLRASRHTIADQDRANA
jgi:uncharacterized protein involved in exopolysaccharide biosynthesis